MTREQHPVRALVAILGTVVLIFTTALAIGSIRPTEATWSDQVVGAAEFGVSPTAGTNFARSSSSFGVLKPWIAGPSNLGSVQREVTPATNWIARSNTPSSWSTESVGNALSSVRASAETRTCARRDNRQPDDCRPLPDQPDAGTATSHAVSQVRNVQASALALLVRVPLVRTSSNPITATASCSPGQAGRAGLTGDPVVIGGSLFDSGDRIDIPRGGYQTSFTRNVGFYSYTGVLQHHRVESAGYAMSQLRLFVEATGDVLGSQPWTFHVVLAHAECGASRSITSAPARPGVSQPAPLPEQSTRMAALRADAGPASLTPVTLMVDAVAGDEAGAGNDDAADGDAVDGNGVGEDSSGSALPALPPVDGAAGNDAGTSGETITPRASDRTQPPAASDSGAEGGTSANPGAGDAESPESGNPDVPDSESAEQSASTEEAQQPESVRVGRQFAVVNRDGVELGSAKIDDIVRTPGCGVELTLSITTSKETGPDRWASIGPRDFAELRSSGATRDARTVSSECDQSAASTITRLSPDREYEIVIAFQLDDSAQRAMLRPEGTAGWVFDLPPLTKVAVVATTVAPVPAAVDPPAESNPGTSAPAAVTDTVTSEA